MKDVCVWTDGSHCFARVDGHNVFVWTKGIEFPEKRYHDSMLVNGIGDSVSEIEEGNFLYGCIKEFLERGSYNHVTKTFYSPATQLIKDTLPRSYRTVQETIDYFKGLSNSYAIDAHRNKDLVAQGKSQAYELAAFELERNLESEGTNE